MPIFPVFYACLFSITVMASTSSFRKIILNENDVPGAKLKHDNVEEHTNFELKRWLECRGLKTGGNKVTLSKRYYFTIIKRFFFIINIFFSIINVISYDLKVRNKGAEGIGNAIIKTV